MTRSLQDCILCLVAIVCTGCGSPNEVKVRGRVTFDSGPLESGVISFAPVQGTTGPAVGGEIRNGQYDLARPIAPGAYAVEIRSWQKTGKRVRGPYGETDEQLNIIPARY